LHGADELARRRRHDPDDHPSNHPAARPEADPQPASARWNALYRSAAAAALITAVLIPIQIAVFIAYPFPDTVTGWFALLQHDPLPGLVDLDLLLVVDNVLLVVIALALYVALRGVSPSITLMATGLWLLAIAMFITANPAVGLLGLSDRFAAATTEAQRSAALAAGQALLAGWDGTAFQVAYVLGQVAGIMVGLVMLRSGRFGRATPYTLITGNLVGFGLYLPAVGLTISAFSGLVLWAWYLLIAPRFFRLDRGRAMVSSTNDRAGQPG
jgi:F0F1-type ATP synthase assembly protein I